MKRAEFEHAVRAAGAVLGTNKLLVIGSQALHASRPRKLPKEAERSVEVDIAAMDEYRKQLEEYQQMVQDITDNFNALLARFELKSPIFEEGFAGMTVVSESGETTCHFEDTWLWMIEE